MLRTLSLNLLVESKTQDISADVRPQAINLAAEIHRIENRDCHVIRCSLEQLPLLHR